ncbi:MAG TPA: hypothetical protein VG275_01595, partial [Solirubrobacteraceae bacterium]|nr:hypothetical protein [Solirubrobacteraceae bacterium]
MSPPAVVHLVWAPLGPDVVHTFAQSYAKHPAGTEHTLTIIYNGFDSPHDPRLEQPRAALANAPHNELVLEQPVQDLTAYTLAAQELQATRYCFLNSYTRLLTPNWLHHLDQALAAPGIGLAGATGSWGSIGSYARFMIGLGGAYGHVFADRRATNAGLARLAAGRDGAGRAIGRWNRYRRFARALLDQSKGFPPFPAPHIRTTGFMISHDVLTRVEIGAPRGKIDAYRLESGRSSITARVLALGLEAVVSGRDGRPLAPDTWPASRTFWAGNQENLLIADKQTDNYERADATLRAILSGYAWGQGAP